MKRIYLAGPITKGDRLTNIKQADDAMKVLVLAGFAVFNPMLSCFAGGVFRHPCGSAYVNGSDDHNYLTHDQWLAMDKEWVEASDAVCRLPGESRGADEEVDHARWCGIPVLHGVEAVIAHFAPKPDHVLHFDRFIPGEPVKGQIDVALCGIGHEDENAFTAVRVGQTWRGQLATGEVGKTRKLLATFQGTVDEIPASFLHDVTVGHSTYAGLKARLSDPRNCCIFLKGQVL